jgi:hypothetical protein
LSLLSDPLLEDALLGCDVIRIAPSFGVLDRQLIARARSSSLIARTS